MNLTQLDLCNSSTKRSRNTSKYVDVLKHEQGLMNMNCVRQIDPVLSSLRRCRYYPFDRGTHLHLETDSQYLLTKLYHKMSYE